jgi:hypothetical protein
LIFLLFFFSSFFFSFRYKKNFDEKAFLDTLRNNGRFLYQWIQAAFGNGLAKSSIEDFKETPKSIAELIEYFAQLN